LYASPNCIRVILRWAGQVGCIGQMRNAYKILARKSEGMRTLRRARQICEDNIRMDCRETG